MQLEYLPSPSPAVPSTTKTQQSEALELPEEPTTAQLTVRYLRQECPINICSKM